MLLRNINWLGSIVILLLVSCAQRPVEDKLVRLEKQKPAVLIQTLDSLSALRPNTFYTKIKCQYSDTTRKLNFRTSIRSIKDSIINPMITYASIPIVNSIIRQDSLIISNRKDKCVIRTTMAFLKESFGVEFKYQNIEELFLGLPVAYDTTQKYFPILDPFNYIISSHRKREIKKETTYKKFEKEPIWKESDNADDENVLIQYYIHPSLKSISKIVILSPEDTTKVIVEYLSRDTVGEYLLPKEVNIDIVTPRNHIVLYMEYDKSEVNTPQEIYFVIPEDYEECQTKN